MIRLLIKFLNKFLILELIFLNACAFSPGMSPSMVENENLYENLELVFHSADEIDFSSLPTQTEKNISDQLLIENLIDENEYRYLIGSSDVINLKATDIDDINGEYTVDNDGFISLPYAGKIMIVNLTKIEAEQLIKNVLENYYNNVELIIEILEYNSRFAYITGEVTKPQSILLNENKVSLLDAILNSGYIKDQVSFDKKALLRRDDIVYTIDLYKLLNEIDMKYNIYLREEDVFHIQKKSEERVFLFGEATQGSYPLYQNSDLTKLLASAKINQVTADADRIFVIREDLNNPNIGNIYEFKLKNPNALLLANKFPLLAGDVIYVSASPIVRWNRVISLITPQSGIFTTYRDINDVLATIEPVQ